MKKIMFFIRSFPLGGAEKLLLDIVKRLDKDEFDITVYSRWSDGEYADEFKKRVKCKTCFSHLRPGKNIVHKLYNFLVINLTEKLMNTFPGFYYRNAIKERFDIEVAFKNDESTKIIAASSNKRSKKIQWMHTDVSRHEGWRLYFKSQKERSRYLKKYDRVICVSKLVEDSIKKTMPDVHNPQVIYNLIDRSDIINRSKDKISTSFIKKYIPVIVSVGRMEFEKRYDLLIKIHKRLIDENVQHYLVLVGAGRMTEELKNMTKEYGVEDSVIFTGYTDNPYPYLKLSDFSVCASLYEGFHLVSAESLVLGKPVISCCPVVGELMGEEQCGILCGYSENELYDAIRTALVRKDLLDSMTAAAQKRSGFFNEEQVIKRIEKMFMEV